MQPNILLANIINIQKQKLFYLEFKVICPKEHNTNLSINYLKLSIIYGTYTIISLE